MSGPHTTWLRTYTNDYDRLQGHGMDPETVELYL